MLQRGIDNTFSVIIDIQSRMKLYICCVAVSLPESRINLMSDARLAQFLHKQLLAAK